MKANDTRAKGMVFNQKVGEYIQELEAEAEINHKLIVRQSDLLTGVANALRGEPGELELHSHHDLPERAATLKEKARAAVNAPYDDVLDMGLAQALRELGEVLY